MTVRIARSWVLTAAVACALVACSGPPATTTPTPTPSATPSATPVIAEPTSRFDFDCGDLAGDVATLFDDVAPEVASDIPREFGRATWLAGPAQYAFAQDGALFCEYGADLSQPDAARAQVVIVADAADAFDAREAALSSTGGCPDAAAPGWPCEPVNGAYVEVTGNVAGGDPASGGTEVAQAFEAVSARVASSEIRPSAWQSPADAIEPGEDCTTILPVQQLAAALESPELDVSYPEGGWSIEAWMLFDRWGAEPCSYYDRSGSPFDAGASYGSISWLPGGQWAYESEVAGDQFDVESADPADAAAVTCGEYEYYSCAVDVLVAQSWVRYVLPEEIAGDDRARVGTQIAQAVVESVRGG